MSRRTNHHLGLLGALSIVGACSATAGGNIFSTSGNADGPGGAASTAHGPSGSGASNGDGGAINFVSGSGTMSSGTGVTCNNDPNVDGDGDGWTFNEGDCNDCDPNVNPGAIEVIATASGDGGVAPAADEDCDGMVDNVAPPCDTGLALTDSDPNSGAKAIELCQFTTESPASKKDKKWGVLSAKYVRANGSASPAPLALQYGIQTNFGPNVHPQGGTRILAISSGHARIPGQQGACGENDCEDTGTGTAPAGFPQDNPSCPGVHDIHDDVALQVKIRTPTNATGYSFDFDFYSFEYPEFVCTEFNDQFIALVKPNPVGSVNGNISFDNLHHPVSVNVAFFNVCQGCPLGTSELSGTGFDGSWGDNAGATGWLKSQAPVTGGTEITVQFTIWDTGDQDWDSTALVDNWQWIANGGSVTVSTDPIPTPK